MYKTHHMLRIFLPTRKDVPKSNIKVTDNAPIRYIRNIGISNMSWPTKVGITDPPIEPNMVIRAQTFASTIRCRSKYITKFPNVGPSALPTIALKIERQTLEVFA